MDPRAVIRLVQHPDRDYRLEGALKLRISVETESDAARFEYAERFLGELRGGGDKLSPRADKGAPKPAAGKRK